MVRNTILLISLVFNVGILVAGGWYVVKKGGLDYLKYKLDNPPTATTAQIRTPSYLAALSCLDILPKNQGDVVFLGDSITAGVDWTKLFADIRIRNMGIGFDSSGLMLQRLDRVIALRPSKVFIMVGITDLNNLHSGIVDILSNYKRMIDRMKAGTPESQIYFQSVLPKQGYASSYLGLNEDIIEVNEQLRQMCMAYENVHYIDLHALFKTDMNQMNPEYTYDGGHLNGKGYLVWKKAIDPYMYDYTAALLTNW